MAGISRVGITVALAGLIMLAMVAMGSQSAGAQAFPGDGEYGGAGFAASIVAFILALLRAIFGGIF